MTASHNGEQDTLAMIARVAGCQVRKYPRVPKHSEDGKSVEMLIPDLAIELHDRTYYIDLAICCTTAPSYVARKSRSTALEEVEHRKIDKYHKAVHDLGAQYDAEYKFVPFVLAVHGTFGKRASLLVYDLAEEAVRNGTCTEESEFRRWARRMLIASLARGNAKVAIGLLRSLDDDRCRENSRRDGGRRLGGPTSQYAV